MIKSTCKEFKEAVQNYIIDCLGPVWDGKNQEENDEAPVNEKLQNVVNCFNSWYCPFYKKNYPNIQEAFKQFLQGLPDCLNIEYDYYSIHEIVKGWFKQTEEEASKYNIADTEKLYYWYIYREFCRLCKKYKVIF